MVSQDLDRLRLPDVLAMRQRTRNSHYRDMKLGLFIRGYKTGARSVAWLRYEVDQLNAARVAGYSDAEIRTLVKRLEAERENAAPKPGYST